MLGKLYFNIINKQDDATKPTFFKFNHYPYYNLTHYPDVNLIRWIKSRHQQVCKFKSETFHILLQVYQYFPASTQTMWYLYTHSFPPEKGDPKGILHIHIAHAENFTLTKCDHMQISQNFKNLFCLLLNNKLVT